MKFDFLNSLFNLCTFDVEGSGGGAGGSEGSGDSGGSNGGGSEGSQGSEGNSKTFTQEELNNILASEKRKNINSVYKDLGFESSEEAKAYLEKHRKEDDDKKDELTKSQERLAELEKEKAAEAKRATEAEYRFKAIESGCDAKNAADVVVLATAKVSEDKDFETALKEIKETYPSLFSSSEGNSGTGSNGSNPRGRRNGSDISGIGKRLAEQRKNSAKSNGNGFFRD